MTICGGVPPVSHLLFADDCFLFFKSKERQVMQNIITMYEETSGQAISLPKSEIYYSRNFHDALKNNITNIMGVHAYFIPGVHASLIFSFLKLLDNKLRSQS